MSYPVGFSWTLSLAPGEPFEGEGGAATPEDARRALERAVEIHLRRVEDAEERARITAAYVPKLGVWVVGPAARALKAGKSAAYTVPDELTVRVFPGPVIHPLDGLKL
ncbi:MULTISPECIES: hypothetical protein [Streptomyces]|uniref:Uncharacterized protein n=2 Tax=Streptomyces TaxID=1883 RepID=A0A1E7LPR8_9ACTN|nr:hypothetical protein [Streptomyces nanshensis]OEV18186.1 hypothetical protein AN221_23905 [Streptomyces nanshensis]